MSSQNESVPRFLPLNNVCKEFRHLEFVKCCPTQKEFNIFSTSKYPEKRNADGRGGGGNGGVRRERGSEEGKGLFLRGVPPLPSTPFVYRIHTVSFLFFRPILQRKGLYGPVPQDFPPPPVVSLFISSWPHFSQRKRWSQYVVNSRLAISFTYKIF